MSALHLLRAEFAALEALHKAAQYRRTAPKDPTGWEPPTATRRSWKKPDDEEQGRGARRSPAPKKAAVFSAAPESAWPKPKHFRSKYTRAEHADVRRAAREHPAARRLIQDWESLKSDLVRQGVPVQFAGWPGSGGAKDAQEHASWTVGDYHWPNFASRRTFGPAEVDAHWDKVWSPHETQARAAMAFWKAHAELLNPATPIDRVMHSLQEGTRQRLVSKDLARSILREIHGQHFVSKRDSGWIPDHETNIDDLISSPFNGPKMSIHDAARRHDEAKAAETQKDKDDGDLYHSAATDVSNAMKSLRERGRSATHAENLRRAVPGLQVEVRSHGNRTYGGGGYEVILSGGPFAGRFRFIGPTANTRDEAWQKVEAALHHVASMPKGMHWADYSRATQLAKARIRRVRWWWAA